MAITSVKLSRLTHNAIGKLREDPTAVSKVDDAYQGYVRPDTSVADNLDRSAKKWGEFGPEFVKLLNAQVAYSNKKGTEEGHDKWLHMNAAQKKKYGDAVRKGDIGSWDSPYVNREMSRMFMAGEANKFTAGFDTAILQERARLGDNFDLTKFGQDYFHEYTEVNNLNQVPPDAFNIFGRSVESTINKAHEKEAVIKATKFQAEYESALRGDITSVFNNTSISDAEKINLLSSKIKKHIEMGFNGAELIQTLKTTIAEQAKILALDGHSDLIPKLFDVFGGLPTDMRKSKEKGGGYYKQSEMGIGYDVWKSQVETLAYKASAERHRMQEDAYQLTNVKLVRGWSEELHRIKQEATAEDPSKGSYTQAQWIKDPAMQQLVAEIDGTHSGHDKVLKFQKALHNIGVTPQEIASVQQDIMKGVLGSEIENPEDIKALLIEKNFTLEQAAKGELWFKAWKADSAGLNIPGFIDGVTDSISGKMVNHEVPEGVRSDIASQLHDSYYEQVEKVMSSDAPSTEKAKAIQKIKDETQASLQKQLTDYTENTAKDFNYSELTKDVEQKSIEIYKNDPKLVSMTLAASGRKTFNVAHKISAKDPKTWTDNDTNYMTDFHLNHNPQIDLVADVYQIPKTEENLVELLKRSEVLLPHLSKQVTGKWTVDEKTYKASLQTLDDFLKHKTGVDAKPEVGIQTGSNVKVKPFPEPSTKVTPPPIDEESTEKVNIGEDSLATKVIDGAENVAEMVGDALLGKKANASRVGTLDKQPTDAELVWDADNYNGASWAERKGWAKNGKERTGLYHTGNHPKQEDAEANVDAMSDVIFSDGKKVFGKELASSRVEVRDIQQRLISIYAAETDFGTHSTKVSPRGALGEMQIIPSTFRSLVRNGWLGTQYEKAIGVSNLESLSSTEVKNLLLNNPKANYLAAMGKYLSRIKHHNIKGVPHG